MNSFSQIPEGEEVAGVVTPVAPRRSMKWGVIAAAAVGLATVGYVSTKSTSTTSALDEVAPPTDVPPSDAPSDADGTNMAWMERDDVKRISAQKVVYGDMTPDDIASLFVKFQVRARGPSMISTNNSDCSSAGLPCPPPAPRVDASVSELLRATPCLVPTRILRFSAHTPPPCLLPPRRCAPPSSHSRNAASLLQSDFNRDYSSVSETEEADRFVMFKKNLVMIDALNRQNPLAKFGITEAGDYTEEVRRELLRACVHRLHKQRPPLPHLQHHCAEPGSACSDALATCLTHPTLLPPSTRNRSAT